MIEKQRYILFGLSALLLQFLLVDLLTVNMVRPDFILIFILFISVWEGRLWGVVVAFFLGLVVDLLGVASYFGLSSLTYVIFAYLVGNLQGKYSKWPPTTFHIFWTSMIIIHFLLHNMITSQVLFNNNIQVFWIRVVMSSVYAIIFAFITNFFLPLGNEE